MHFTQAYFLLIDRDFYHNIHPTRPRAIRKASRFRRNMMCDYPKSLPEFQKIFPDDDTCANWLFEMRWPDVSSVPPADTRYVTH